MSRLDELPPDQRAALSLLLRQRKSYAEVAELLGIAEQAVHDRAHAALAMLAPRRARELTPEHRREIGDYLLGQQPGVAERLRTRAYSPATSRRGRGRGELAAQLAAARRLEPARDPRRRESGRGGHARRRQRAPARVRRWPPRPPPRLRAPAIRRGGTAPSTRRQLADGGAVLLAVLARGGDRGGGPDHQRRRQLAHEIQLHQRHHDHRHEQRPQGPGPDQTQTHRPHEQS